MKARLSLVLMAVLWGSLAHPLEAERIALKVKRTRAFAHSSNPRFHGQAIKVRQQATLVRVRGQTHLTTNSLARLHSATSGDHAGAGTPLGTSNAAALRWSAPGLPGFDAIVRGTASDNGLALEVNAIRTPELSYRMMLATSKRPGRKRRTTLLYRTTIDHPPGAEVHTFLPTVLVEGLQVKAQEPLRRVDALPRRGRLDLDAGARALWWNRSPTQTDIVVTQPLRGDRGRLDLGSIVVDVQDH